MIRLAILASGSGTNAENIIKYFSGSDKISIEVIISNKSDAFVHQRAKNLGIESETLPIPDLRDGKKMVEYMQSKNIDYIILAGYLLMIPKELVENYPNRIINIHPALLPKHGGKGMYGDNVHKAVLEAKDAESGITIHYVNENYDEGQTIFQATCKVDENDSPDSLAKKIHALEHEYFPIVLERVCL